MKNINLAIFTTKTPHHIYFVNNFLLNKPDWINVKLILNEEKKYPWSKNRKKYIKSNFKNIFKWLFLNPYIQPSLLENITRNYESKKFFNSENKEYCNEELCKYVIDINNNEVVEDLKKNQIDLIFVYGTGKIEPEVFNIPKYGAINAHGGRLPKYRGLDTNLWAIYNGDYEDVYICLHKMDVELDTGKVIIQEKLRHNNDLNILNLRYYSTIHISELAVSAIHKYMKNEYQNNEKVDSHYYSVMPFLTKLFIAIKLKLIFK